MRAKSFFSSFLLLSLILSGSLAFASSNILLDSWIYYPLERLVNSGLVDHASLSTKPLSRQEAAEIVAQAIQKIQKGEDTYGIHNPFLEEVLDILTEEFKWELQRMDSYPLEEESQPKWYSLKPLEMVQVRTGYAEDPYLLENSQADRLAHGFNLRVGGSARAELAEYVSLYVHPEYRYDDEENKGYFLETYGKLTLFNVELEVGRDSMWWGPGYHGSLLLSNNGLPLDLVKLSSATPFQIPWIFRYLGYFDLTFFLSQLEKNRDFPHAKLMGMRIDWSPTPPSSSWPILELGASRVVLFDGEGKPSYDLGDYWDIFTARDENQPGSKYNNNQLASLDATLRFRNIGRYFPLADSLVLYGEYGGEDVTGESGDVPFPYKAGYIGGILLQDLFMLQGLDLRAEYARTHEVWYSHTIFTSGYTYKGVVLGHHMGGDSDDLYFRLSHWFTKSLQASLELDQQKHGLSQSVKMRERYVEPSVLVFHPGNLSLSARLGYRFVRTENADFKRGNDHDNHIVFFDLRYDF